VAGRIDEKLSKGARFVVSQPVFDVEAFRPLLESLQARGVIVMLSVMPLISLRNAEYLHYEVPGITIPPGHLARMEGKAGKQAIGEGVAIAQETIRALRPLCQGILVMPPLEKYRLVGAILDGLD
jgi:methionine synthase / methylenetetrahydrofolate reductase(NADPH)